MVRALVFDLNLIPCFSVPHTLAFRPNISLIEPQGRASRHEERLWERV